MKAVLFDFNGTLFNDTDIHIDVWRKYIKEKLYIEFSSEEFLKRIFGRDNNAIIADIFHIDDLNEIHRISEEKEQRYRDICSTMDISLVKGATGFFDILKEKKIPFTIATGANKSNVDFYFKVFHLDRWFDYDKVVYDDGYLPGKPDPAIYRLACEKLGVDPQDVMVIEDSPAGVTAAKRAGISEIYVISSKDSFPYEVKGIIRDFDELRDLLCWKQKD